MYNPIEIIDYEKLVDEIYSLGNGYTLKFNVILNRKNEDGTRRSFHSEYGYNSDKYTDANTLYTVKRAFNFSLVIDSSKVKTINISIGPTSISRVIDALNAGMDWFDNNKFKDLFMTKEGKLIRIGSVDMIVVDRLSFNGFMAIEPIVVEYEDSMHEGIRLFINSMNDYVDMTLDRYAGLVYLVSNINMYESAQLLINYNGRPKFGYNSMDFTNAPKKNIPRPDIPQQAIPNSSIKKSRMIPGTYKKDDIDIL